MDANGDMHRFGEPTRPPVTPYREPDEPERPQSGLPSKAAALRLPVEVVQLLIRVRQFLDNEVVTQAHNGARIPLTTVNRAATLSVDVKRMLE